MKFFFLFVVLMINVLMVPLAWAMNPVLSTLLILEQQKTRGTQAIQANASTTSSLNTQTLKNAYALVLFYRASCPHCQHFDPVVKAYSQETGIKTYAYTTDGNSLPSFPQSMAVTPDVIQRFFGDTPVFLPTVYLVNVNTLAIYPVASGEMSYDDFSMAVERVAAQLEESDNETE